GRYTRCMSSGKKWNTVQRQRFPLEEVDAVIAEVRATLRERGRTQTQWEVGSSAPAGLVDALLERGIERDKEPYAVALVLTSEPPAIAPMFTARRVETFEEYAAANAVQWEAFESSAEDIAESRELLPQRYRETVNVMHAVWLDGEIVGAGASAPTDSPSPALLSPSISALVAGSRYSPSWSTCSFVSFRRTVPSVISATCSAGT